MGTWKRHIDWKLLLLLLLFLNVKLVVKIPALLLIYLLQPDFRFGFRLRDSKLPLFYVFIIGIALLTIPFNKGFADPAYWAVFLTGIGFWLICLLVVHQLRVTVDRQNADVIHRTLLLFFVLNAAVSAFNIIAIMLEINMLNPYLYQGQYQKYFIGTGDYIKGLTFDTSTTNAIINGIGVLYFLARKQYVMLLVCMCTLLLTGSNFLNIIILLLFTFLFIFQSTREQKSFIVISVMLMVVFISKVSPQNFEYVGKLFRKTASVEPVQIPGRLAARIERSEPSGNAPPRELRKEEIARSYLDSMHSQKEEKKTFETFVLPQQDIHSASHQSIKEPPPPESPVMQFIARNRSRLPLTAGQQPATGLPGKLTGTMQTVNDLGQHPADALTGNGIGNFSSKLAFRATGLGIAGGFPARYTYVNDEFMENHLDLYLYYFSKQTGFHSLVNTPFSVYDQLLAEYGVPGLLVFLVFYLGFFLKHLKKLTYGLPLLLLMLTVFFVDYWFEQLSVIVLFELLLLLDIKETA